jgi:DNA-binding response OmpR family regulator
MKIFLIEDDLDDIELLQAVLKEQGVSFEMDIANDGSAAVVYIKNCREFPDIIILDFNLPKIHGKEVMLEIKSDRSFKDIPLVILTTSSAKEDIDYSYKNGANKYLVKPNTLEGLSEIVKEIEGVAAGPNGAHEPNSSNFRES